MITKNDVEQVLAEHPLLHYAGYGYGRCGCPDISMLRAELLTDHSVATIAKVVDWLPGNFTPTRAIRRENCSYGLKHVIERAIGEYVSNGQAIVALLLAGYKMGAPFYNPFFAISDASVRRARRLAVTA